MTAATVEVLPPSPATWPPAADDPRWAALAAPFEADEVELLPKPTRKDNQAGPCDRPDRNGLMCGGWHGMPAIHLHYVGHAGVTQRLNQVDPTWDWEPVATTEHGTPMSTDGGMWIRLTVLGVTRLAFGDASGKSGPNAVKEAIGDAIRNGAMRFGVGTYLWSKSEKAQALAARHDNADPDAGEYSPPIGQGAVARQEARSQTRQAARQQPRPAPAAAPAPDAPAADAHADPAPEVDPAALAVQVAKASANSSDVGMLRRTYTEASQRGVLRVPVQDHLHDALLSAAGVPLDRPVLLGAWLQACAAIVTANRKSVAKHAKDLEDPWDADAQARAAAHTQHTQQNPEGQP